MEILKDDYQLQKQYIDKIKNINDKYTEEIGKIKKAYINTYGCQMNVRDSETLQGMLRDMGYSVADKEEEADLIVYNTCCVRENAENKVYGNLGELKAAKLENPDLKIILCGCMMQQDTVIENIKKSYRHVDVIFGTFNLQRFPELLVSNIETKKMIIDVWEEHTEIIEDLPAIRESDFKASVNIMYGCNNFCTYCIVPYVRGRERSREVADILQEIRSLADEGVIEILLLGQNVNSYGKNLENPVSFADLLREVNKIDKIERIRFMTSHPKDISEDVIYAMKESDKVCNHLHLPFQSGSNKILKSMNRGYTKEYYIKLTKKAREIIPNIGLTTDIIVGFPGETEEDFQDTMDVVKQSAFNTAYTFIYSKRVGTPAANMDNQISENDIKDRFKRLLKENNDVFYDTNQYFEGMVITVLAEEVNAKNPKLISGRSEQNVLVHFEGDESHVGKIVTVKIIESLSFYMMGELI